jgi:hypothetical protein
MQENKREKKKMQTKFPAKPIKEPNQCDSNGCGRINQGHAKLINKPKNQTA